MKRSLIKLALAALLVIGVAVLIASAYRDADFDALYDDEKAIRAGSGSSIIMNSLSECEDGTLHASAEAAYGIFDVWNGRDAQEVTFTAELSVTSGRAKLVYCEKGCDLLVLAESAGEPVSCTATVTPSGRADVRLVCDGADYTLTMEATTGQLTVP